MIPKRVYDEFVEKFSDKKHIAKLIKRYFEENSENFEDILEAYREEKLNEIKKD